MGVVEAQLESLATVRACPLCGSSRSMPALDEIRRCRDCGMSYVANLNLANGTRETEDYFLHEYLPLHQQNWQPSLAERRAHLEMIRGFSELPTRPRLLDVGCALGLMLQEAKAANWDAIGVEPSEFAARYAAEHAVCPVFAGTLEQAGFESGSFDVVTLMDVIEHVPEPQHLLIEIHRILRPGGVVFLITPNFGSFFVHLYGRKAYGVGPSEHINCFKSGTLKKLLLNSGFERVKTGTKDFYADNVHRLVRWHAPEAKPDVKAAFGSKAYLRSLRTVANKVLMQVPIGDKLIALAQK